MAALHRAGGDWWAEATAKGILKIIIGDKREWRAMEARAKALPEEYEYVYHRIQKYMWTHASGHSSGMDMIELFKGLLDLFESGAANGRRVLEITGEDVAAFCDELLKNADTYTEDWRLALNNDIMEKLGKDGGPK
jgi:DNA-binding ferritin-like protein (Dps family)